MAANGNVKIVSNDLSFLSEIQNAGSKLVIIDFHATWCGPCKNIAPVFVQESLKYPNSVFLKVDVDVCTETAHKYGINAMPTFVFVLQGKKIDELRGADPKALIAKIKQHSGDSIGTGSNSAGESEVPGHSDLISYITASGCNCLNESDEHTHANIFKKDNTYLESDCDEQLLLSITFNQAMKVHSLKIDAPTDGRGPKFVKLFVNQPSAIGFDQAESMEGVQHIDLTEEDITGEKLIPLRFVKFQNVTNLVIFFASNQGSEETTVIKYLKIIGSPVESTNMNDFKRIAGKAGESH
ncbi:thioredoxin-like protein 1 [Hydra vulgaris]|uniref:Thioredoxin-like protein 1 n=1 Tax=Hydra vulgaris TaxID=6087 RepID=T2MIP7_HYDVU|nr:thioredoxin-like protein 1 [Hydra vulgaris]